MSERAGFKWKDIGDIAAGRANLGCDMPVAVYRLFEFCTKDVLVRRLGEEEAKAIIYESGFLAGTEFYKNIIAEEGLDFDGFVAKLQRSLKEQKIGVLKIERADLENKTITLTVAEDVDCSGMPLGAEPVCNYDEGLIAGLLYGFTGEKWSVTEVDCWTTGDTVCRFKAVL